MTEEEGCSSISHPSVGKQPRASKHGQSGSVQRKQRGGREGRREGTHPLLAAGVLWARKQRAGVEWPFVPPIAAFLAQVDSGVTFPAQTGHKVPARLVWGWERLCAVFIPPKISYPTPHQGKLPPRPKKNQPSQIHLSQGQPRFTQMPLRKKNQNKTAKKQMVWAARGWGAARQMDTRGSFVVLNSTFFSSSGG